MAVAHNQLKPAMWAPGWNRSHPLANGLVFAMPFWGDGQSYTDIVGGKVLTGYNTPTRAATDIGRAVLFDNGSSEYLGLGSAIVTEWGFTMSCLFNSDDAAAFCILMSIADSSSALYNALAAVGTVAGDPVRVFRDPGAGDIDYASTTTGFAANTWHHAAGVFEKDHGYVWIDGGSGGSKASTLANLTGMDATKIGVSADSTPFGYMSGHIACPCIWNRSLTDGEVAELAADPWGMFRPPRAL